MLVEVTERSADALLVTTRTVVGLGHDPAVAVYCANARDIGAEVLMASLRGADDPEWAAYGFDQVPAAEGMADAQILVVGAEGANFVLANLGLLPKECTLVVVDARAVGQLAQRVDQRVDVVFAQSLFDPDTTRLAHVNGRGVQAVGAVYRNPSGRAAETVTAWIAAVCGAMNGSLVATEGQAAEAVVASQAVLRAAVDTALVALHDALSARGCPAPLTTAVVQAMAPAIVTQAVAGQQSTRSSAYDALLATMGTLPLAAAVHDTVCPDIARFSSAPAVSVPR